MAHSSSTIERIKNLYYCRKGYVDKEEIGLFGASTNCSYIKNSPTPDSECVVTFPEFFATGEYTGDTTIQKSNRECLVQYLPDDFPYIFIYGAYGYESIGFLVDREADWDILLEYLESLEEYPVLDEEHYSNLEHETIQEEWKECGLPDLENRLEDFSVYEVVDSDKLTELYFNKAEYGKDYDIKSDSSWFNLEVLNDISPISLIAAGILVVTPDHLIESFHKNHDEFRRVARIHQIAQTLRYMASCLRVDPLKFEIDAGDTDAELSEGLNDTLMSAKVTLGDKTWYIHPGKGYVHG